MKTRMQVLVAAAVLLAACSDRPTDTRPPVAPGAANREVMSAATEYDLTVFGSSVTIGGSIFSQAHWASTGTGLFDPFVRLQNTPMEQGYNTSYRPPPMDDDASQWTKDVRLDNIPIVVSGGVAYREFVLDFNQSNSEPLISLEALKVFVGTATGIHGVDPTAADFGIGATLVYDMNSSGPVIVKMDYSTSSSGSGNGDAKVWIPNAAFGTAGQTCQYDDGAGSDCSAYVYLYSKFGPTYATNAGFEEWAARNTAWVNVGVSAATTFTRSYTWSLSKSASPSTLSMFRGDSKTTQYTVTATRTGYTDANWAVSGSVTINNPTAFTAPIAAVSVQLPGFSGAVAVNCGAVTFPYNLAPGGSLTCSYSASLPDGTARTATANVALDGMGGNWGTANVTFGTPTSETNASVTVSDTNGSTWTFTGTGSQQYTKTFSCNTDEGTHTNTATMVTPSHEASATVTVACYDLSVTKTAPTSLTRTWTWGIDKTKGASEPSNGTLTLQTGELYIFNYGVSVNTTGHTDSNWGVSGNIVITNPAPVAATLTSVTDALSGVTAPTPSCPSLTVPASGSLTCTYSSALPDATTRTNTATAVLQNHSYTAAGAATATGTTSFSSTAVSVSFASPTVTKVHDCVTVTDTFGGSLGTACVTETLPKVFTYTHQIGPYESCGSNTISNTATFTTNGPTASAVTGSDTYNVTANVPCIGCTLTQGYWKTHNASFKGGAPVDDGWGLLTAAKEGTTFYASGATYFDVLWTPPKGNAYYVLAKQYIAAQLNILNGMSDATVATQMAAIQNFFATANPTTDWAKDVSRQLTSWASVLDTFNNRYHCSEDRTSSSAP